MAQTREIAQEREEFFREAMEWKSPYELWKESQSLPTIRGLGVHGLYDDLAGTDPAGYVAMTAAPRVIDTFKILKFVFDNPFVFDDRFNGEDSYFKERPMAPNRHGPWETNFVADVMEASFRRKYSDTMSTWGRAIGGFGTSFNMVNSTMRSHSSGWAVGTYKKGHRHGPGIHVLILAGTGYSLMWQGDNPIERVDWRPGSMFVPP